jgi:hypothetical protein
MAIKSINIQKNYFGTEGVAQVVKYLPNKHKALNSSPNTKKTNTKNYCDKPWVEYESSGMFA